MRNGGCPAKVGFEGCGVAEIRNRSNGGNDGRSLERAKRRNGGQNLPLAALFHSSADLSIKLLKMVGNELEFFNQLVLFKE